jgi:Domain of unknown function (DUF4873)
MNAEPAPGSDHSSDHGADHGACHGDPGYVGPAAVLIGEEEVAVQVDLRGYFQPIDGRFHWYGRVAANAELTSRVSGTRAEVVLRTPRGERPAELSDPDLWGRFRVSGHSTPPFQLDTDLPAS